MDFFAKYFNFSKYGTSLRTEIIAGFTTFLTMVYIIIVNPSILSAAGMDAKVVFVVTCLIAGLGSIAMGLFANLPVAVAPGMGLNAFFAYVVVLKLGISWEIGMGAIFWGAVGLFALTLFKIRYWLIANIPLSLRVGITSGIGLFIAFMGLVNAGVIVDSPATLVSLGDLHSTTVLLGLLGFGIIVVLSAWNIHASVLISIAVVTFLAWLLGLVGFHGVFSIPPSLSPVLGKVDVVGSLDLDMLGIIFSFMLVNLFDSSGTLLGVTERAGLCNEKGQFPKMKQALYVDSLSSVAGAYMGTSAVTSYIESSSGVSVGGRTGMVSVVVGLLFLCAIFFSPIMSIVPTYATAGALIFVGVLMTSSLGKVNWDDLTEGAPAFITAVMMPLSYSITDGIAFGFISYCLIKTFSGKFKDVSLPVWAVGILFVVKIVFLG